MAARLLSPETSEFPKLSTKIAFHDIGAVLATTAQFSQLRNGLLFISTPIYLATDADREFLREKLRTRTVVSTLYPKEPRYIHGKVPGSYTAETLLVQDFLGLKTCHIHLRYGEEYVRNAINELPFWSRLKFQYDTATAKDRTNPELTQVAQNLIWNRDSIDDSFAILTTSAPLIGRLFNNILCEAKSYPIIVSGDSMLRDNALLMFLMLLLLEIPLSAIENAYMRITDGLQSRLQEAGVEETPATQAWAANRQDWASKLFHRLEARYGSISAYFHVAGVSENTRDRTKNILLVSEEKTLVDVE